MLTKKKQSWVNKFKPKQLKGSALNPSAAVAARYNDELQKMVDRMMDQVEKEIKKFFESDTAEEFYAQDASISSQARIMTNFFITQIGAAFSRKAKGVSERMVKGAEASSKTALHSSLRELSGGLSLKTGLVPDELNESFTAAVAENIQLIKNIPQQTLTQIQGAVMRSIQPGGNGLQDLIPYLESQKEITKRRARNIALDQTRKAFNEANTIRMQSLGIKKFEWVHSGGGVHPRHLHKNVLNGKTFSFDDLPVIGVMYGAEVRGIPGQLPNCRCTMRPVIEFEDDDGN